MLKQRLVCTTLMAVTLAGSAYAAEMKFGTPTEAKAMLGRAAAAVKVDRTGAIDKFNHNDPQFRDRDLFVFCFNATDGRFTAHEAFVSWDARELRDSKGKAFGMEMHAKAQEDRIAEVDFTSPVPGSTELATRVAHVTRIGDQVCGVSAYRSQRDPSTVALDRDPSR